MVEYMCTILNGLKAWATGEVSKLRAKIKSVEAAVVKAASAAAQNKKDIAALSQDLDGAYDAADAAQSTADAAQSTADAAQSTADAAQSTANKKIGRVNTTSVTISIGSISYSNPRSETGLNIANGSTITATSGAHSATAVWDGSTARFSLGNASVQISLDCYDKYTIRVETFGTIVTDLALTYDKVEIPTIAYTPVTGAWLPPYVIMPFFYLVSTTTGSTGSSSARRVFKITVDDTGTLSATEVTS